MDWTTGAAILTHVRISAPSADESAWADACAAAVNIGIDRFLGWASTNAIDLVVERDGNGSIGWTAYVDSSTAADVSIWRFVLGTVTEQQIRECDTFETRSPEVGILYSNGFRVTPANVADGLATAETYLVKRLEGTFDFEITARDPRPGPPVDGTAEIEYAALLAGAEAFARRAAPFGVTGYSDIQGVAIRVARDPLEGVRPLLERWRYVAGSFA